jgi:hypothetical protein
MKLVTFVLVALISPTVSAQEYAFKVLVNKGENQVKAGNSWLPVKVGASLKSADELRVSQNGYLGLVHATGKPLEVKDAGQHKVVDLAAKIKEGTSVLNKYTDFILSSKTAGGNSLTATGAVHRGPDEIKVYLPKAQQAIVFNDEIVISWAKVDKTKAYVVRFNTMFGDQLEKLEVTDTTVTINLRSAKFANEDNILVDVSSKQDPKKASEPVMLKKLSVADMKRINTALAEISVHTSEQTALNQLLLAGFYENHGLLIDAATSFHKAIQLAPTVAQYRTEYAEFITRNGMKK